MQTEDLTELAAEIKVEIALARHGSEHEVRAGELLIEAKARVKAGGARWEAWLADNFGKSARTARLYMRVARNGNAVAGLSLREADRELRREKREAKEAGGEFPDPETGRRVCPHCRGTGFVAC